MKKRISDYIYKIKETVKTNPQKYKSTSGDIWGDWNRMTSEDLILFYIFIWMFIMWMSTYAKFNGAIMVPPYLQFCF